MSDNMLALLQQGGQIAIPQDLAALVPHSGMSEMREGVSSGFGVLSIKGKTFGVKHGGKMQQLTVNVNGNLFAAPYMDVVMVMANANLSKTYYASTFSEGSDAQPDCWSEDGVTPLSPMATRPKDLTGQPCMDCRLCPFNAFGSRVTADGRESKGKACADTRKVAIVPVSMDGQIDFHGDQYGGPILMRVPAASLSVLRDYDVKLGGIGLPYYFVVTRLSFDPQAAYPRLVFAAVRALAAHEAQQVIAMRDSSEIQQLLKGGSPTVSQPIAAPQIAAPVAPPVQAAPVAPPVQAAPVAPPVQAAPVAPPVQAAPVAPPVQAAPVAPPVQAAPVAPPVQAAPVAPPVQAAPVPQIDDNLLGAVDALLASQ